MKVISTDLKRCTLFQNWMDQSKFGKWVSGIKIMFNLFKKQENAKIPWKEGRKLMDKTLKTFVVPEIRKFGFSGSYPHFRRMKDNKLEFISFQFSLYGPSFIVEAGKTTKEQLSDLSKDMPFEKLNHGNTAQRFRIKPDESISDHWYSFEDFIKVADFENVARSIIPLISKAEEFFARTNIKL